MFNENKLAKSGILFAKLIQKALRVTMHFFANDYPQHLKSLKPEAFLLAVVTGYELVDMVLDVFEDHPVKFIEVMLGIIATKYAYLGFVNREHFGDVFNMLKEPESRKQLKEIVSIGKKDLQNYYAGKESLFTQFVVTGSFAPEQYFRVLGANLMKQFAPVTLNSKVSNPLFDKISHQMFTSLQENHTVPVNPAKLIPTVYYKLLLSPASPYSSLFQ
jgi:hypothetical protein